MSYIESKLALQEGLLSYFESLLEESSPVNPSAQETAESISEDIGVIVHFPIISIINEAKRISAFRAKYTSNEKGEPNMAIALTTDEDDLIKKILSKWANRVFDEVSSASLKVPNAYSLEDNATINVYVAQTAFESGEIYLNGTTLYRCLAETEEIPSDDSIYWIKIEDGDEKRVYFSFLINPYWDTNASTLLETSLFDAMVTAILKEWFKITNMSKMHQEYSEEYEKNIMSARSATYRRTKGITLKQPFL